MDSNKQEYVIGKQKMAIKKTKEQWRLLASCPIRKEHMAYEVTWVDTNPDCIGSPSTIDWEKDLLIWCFVYNGPVELQN